MEVALSAFFGEIAQRSISFVVDKLTKEAASLPLPCDEHLRRKLLRVRVIVQEAEGRQIGNDAMLDELKILRAGMYGGYYVLDAFHFQHQRASREEDDDDHEHEAAVSHHHYSFAVSKFNPAKRIQLWGKRRRRANRHGGDGKEMHQVIGSLEIMITDAREFVMFLAACSPLLNRQPYSTYLIMEKCMFGRHVEMEHIIKHQHQRRHASDRQRLLLVVELDGDIDEATWSSLYSASKRLLLILELDGDIDEATWSRLYTASISGAANGSKIIICSRSDEIARFGTTQPLRVEYPTREAYWYFFKALAFGSANPEEPRLAAVATEIAECMNSSFIAANMMARMLRANFSVKFWSMAVSWIRGVRQRNGLIFGGHPVSPWQNKKPAYAPRISNPNKYFWIFYDYQSINYQVVYAHDEIHPEITLQEVLLRDVVPHGHYDVLVWRSSIPPRSCCIFRYGVYNKPQKMSIQKKCTRS